MSGPPEPGTREGLLADVVRLVPPAQGTDCVRVAVDGVDGAGKTTFADALARALRAAGRPVVRVQVDGFHQVPVLRYRRGRDSPEGFFRDSFDLRRLRSEVLEPLGPGGDRHYRDAVHDVRREASLDLPQRVAPPGAVLVLDGLFLHRDELATTWDLSVFLDVPFDVTFARMAVRDGCDPDPSASANRRYLEGQRLYLSTARPAKRADVVIDNTNPVFPRRVR